ncbi:MAG: ribosome maturation factor RimP [Tuberibacillus sp.]
MAGKIAEAVKVLIEPILSSLQIELVEVKYVKEGKNWVLKIFIDSPQGVDLDMCTMVSERVSDVLDENDPISDAYFLEVSSPGAERPLKGLDDYKKSVGKNVRITTYESIDGKSVFEGVLDHVEEDHITISVKDKTKVIPVDIPVKLIASARLAVVF